MRILVVEDDASLAEALMQGVSRMGLHADHADAGELADSMLKVRRYDAVVLDLGLPDIPGMTVLRRLRTRNRALPVLILTARDAIQDRVQGLDAGADDYLLKPFDFMELEARLRALLRRSAVERGEWLEAGPLSLDDSHSQVLFKGNPLPLSARETAVLALLMRRAGRVVSKEALLEHMAPDEGDIGDNAVEVYVHRVRKKLEPTGVAIRTLRGLGYLLDIGDGG